MKYRIPDIKTVDMFFEILSDPKKVVTHLAEMRGIRDKIKEGLELVDTKAKAEKLLRDANVTMANAKDREREVRADAEADASRLENDIARHKETVTKDKKNLSDARKQLTADISEFSGAKSTAETDIDSRLLAVEAREGAVTLAEEAVLTRETAMNSWADKVAEAKASIARI